MLELKQSCKPSRFNQRNNRDLRRGHHVRKALSYTSAASQHPQASRTEGARGLTKRANFPVDVIDRPRLRQNHRPPVGALIRKNVSLYMHHCAGLQSKRYIPALCIPAHVTHVSRKSLLTAVDAHCVTVESKQLKVKHGAQRPPQEYRKNGEHNRMGTQMERR